jgi:hypothetical protein
MIDLAGFQVPFSPVFIRPFDASLPTANVRQIEECAL